MNILQKDLIRISQKTNGRCFYCNTSDATEVDHFVSKKKWEEWKLNDVYIDYGIEIYKSCDNIRNLFLACKKCNSSKNAKCPEDFIGNSYKAWDRYEKANKRVGII